MRILIDSTQIPIGRTGVGIYAEQLIQKLAPIIHPDDKLFILVQTDDRDLHKLIAEHPNLFPLPISSRIFRNRLALLFYEQFILPWRLIYHHIDIMHSLHYTFPLICHCCRIVTLHDMTFFIWPEMHTRGRKIVMSFFAKLALRYAEGVLFVSKSAQTDTENLFGRGSNLRAVTPLAVDHPNFDNIQPEAVTETLLRLEVKRPYILFVGTLEPRKNVVRLIQAFDTLGPQHAGTQLVLAGKLGWHFEEILQAIKDSPNASRIHRLGYVAAKDKPPLIAGCDIMIYPSIYEGFGLPILEGMAAGVAVITGNIGSLPEVAGDAAFLIDPSSVKEITAAMDSILSNDQCRNFLRIAGKKRASQYSWEKTAELTYVAYQNCMQHIE